MKSLLKALKEGRLTELPSGCGKEQALELLAHLIEAIPDIGCEADLAKGIMDREAQANTGIGMGVAVPHCRNGEEGELLCAAGWSPAGIDYGAPDGKNVHLIVMYSVPDSRRADYLKEISGLANALKTSGAPSLSGFRGIGGLRGTLLDWVELSVRSSGAEAGRTRMLRIFSREGAATAAAGEESGRLLSFRLVSWPGGSVVLCNDPELSRALEAEGDGLAKRMSAARDLSAGGWRIAVLAESDFAGDKREYEAVALGPVTSASQRA